MTDRRLIAFENSEISWPRSLRFILLLIFDIPSVVCSLFVLYHLLINRTSRHALHNHTIIILLTISLAFQLTDIPWYLDFIRRGSVWPQIPIRCLLWWLVDLGFYNTAALILAWSSIERHILVFHDQWISTRKKRFYVHYLPLIILILYSTIYYTVLIFFPPCHHKYIYVLPVCAASPCHLFHPILGLWEMGIHGCLSTIIIAAFSIALLVRVIVHKRRRNRVFQWKFYRKMIIQLLSISALYLLLNFPIMIFSVARLCGLPSDIGVEVQQITFFLTYWVMFLLPFVALSSLPGLRKKMDRIGFIKHRRQKTFTMAMKRIISTEESPLHWTYSP
ncbi:unnamed protein product [Rotaria magnacalcarata]|uniref:G-protein coupled receptors family 1 profile domain-containing protein n=1 Tax=Rotaria magnacalcarata TaxID=392030 RepID=A0A816EDR9_9BILA|nr:unnamed protein product [Rotaria magnacalcarata]CAF1645399.1 unnamed protein product [Rotaria magnacalcarata]CAF2096947.1 unnamed protein product [Rotaria magnacalcarata]CAF2097533.1 unnamed protein product [Rotaria magnacalcarata]CAF2178407.1 unnamed protein product [Rotaria magnacalcarata]